jgi:probable phosphomutase (TIGR03848 family)
MAKKPSTDTLVLFVRHGRTPTTGKVLPGRAKGLHLSDQGRSQAEGVATRITSSIASIDAIYTSPLERCKETAAPLARKTGLRAVAHKGLLECDFGDWTGSELKKLYKLPEWKVVQHAPSQFRFPGGESMLEMQARVNSAITAICAEHPGQTVVLFSHADPIKTALIAAMGTPMDMFQRISVSPCSVSAVLYGSTSPTVLAVNTVEELGSLQPS